MSLALATKGILTNGNGVVEKIVQVGGGDAGLVHMSGKPLVHVISLKQRDRFPSLSLLQVKGDNGD